MKRWKKRLAWAVAAPLLLVLVLIVGVLLWLQTGHGGAFVRDKVVAAANEQLSGSLEVGEIDFRFDVIVLRDLVLRAPDGEVVAEIEEVLVDLAPTALFSRTAKLDLLQVQNPHLYVEQDAQGTNLQRALAPREPKPEEPKKEGSGALPVHVVLERLLLEDVLLSFEQQTSDTPLKVLVEALDVSGQAALRRDGNVQAELAGRGRFEQPTQGPLRLDLQVSGTSADKTFIDAVLEAAGAKLRARAELGDGERLDAFVEELLLPPSTVRAFVPAWSLQVPLTARAEAHKRGDEIAFDAKVGAGAGVLTAQGAFDVERMTSSGVEVVGEDLNFAELAPGAPKSQVDFRLDARGGGTSLETMDGELTLVAPRASLEGEAFGPIRVHATADDGTLLLEELAVMLPGLSLEARGNLTPERVALSGRLDARNLRTLGNTLGRLASPEGLPLAGRGDLTFQLEGPARTPGLTARGAFEQLRYGVNEARGLQLEAKVPNVSAPLSRDVHVALRMDALRLGEKRLERPHLSLDIESRELRLDAGTRGFATLDLAGRGRLNPEGTRLALSSLAIQYPEARWQLACPATIDFGGETKRIRSLVLRSGPQELGLDATLSGAAFDAKLEVERLNLARLPGALVGTAGPLGGEVNAAIAAEGTAERPRVNATLRAADVRFGKFHDLHAQLGVRWNGVRADGEIAARLLDAKLNGKFRLPVEELLEGGRSPVYASFDLERVALQPLLTELGVTAPVEGVADASLRLTGTANRPSLDAKVRLQDGRVQAVSFEELVANVASGKGGRLGASLHATLEGKPSVVNLQTPWTLSRLLRRPPTAKEAMRAPLAVQLALVDLPVPMPAAAPANGAAAPVAATRAPARVDGQMTFEGSVLAPRGGGKLTVQRLQLGASPPLSGELRLQLRRDDHQLWLDVEQGERAVLRGHARVEAEPERLLRPAAATRVPLTLTAEWGPIALAEIQRMMPRPQVPGEEATPIFQGVTTGKIALEGSLSKPELALSASVYGLGTGTTPVVGDASVRYRYASGQNAFEADLLSGAAGLLQLRTKVPLELSIEAFRRGVDWRDAPLEATLTANGFDPAFLAGATPTVLALGGRLNAKVLAKGQLSLPNISGRLEWENGRVALLGMGDYRNIHLLVEGNEREVHLRELTAQAEGGKARLEGRFTREGEAVRLRLSGDLEEFPIIQQDQLVATVSLETKAEGTASVERIDIPRLRIDEAHIQLPTHSAEELQALTPPENVTFVYNGKPLEPDAPAAQHVGVGGSGASEEQPASPTREVRVVIDAPRNLWVRGQDMNIEVGLGPDFRVEYGNEMLIFGVVRTHRGFVEVMGRRFELAEDSAVRFTGPMLQPRIDATAIHVNEREDVTIQLRVTGTGQDINIEPSSDPPLSDTEIYTLIATGRRSLRPGSTGADSGGGGAAAAATSFLGSFAAAQLQQHLENVLPLDVLDIQPGESGLGGTRVEVGTYLSDRFYLGVQTDIGTSARMDDDENRNQLNIEYELSKFWMLDLEYGDARRGNADLVRRRRY